MNTIKTGIIGSGYIWDIDPACTPDKPTGLLEKIREFAVKQGKNIKFNFLPFCWEE